MFSVTFVTAYIVWPEVKWMPCGDWSSVSPLSLFFFFQCRNQILIECMQFCENFAHARQQSKLSGVFTAKIHQLLFLRFFNWILELFRMCFFSSLYHYKGSLYVVKIEKDVRCITTVQPFLIFEDGKGMKKREY